MLDTLYIKNFAIIDELEVNFDKGLNVLSGETGAGKSIIIGSINFVLGSKATREIIKSGQDKCEVSMLVYVDDKDIIDKLADLDVEVDDDNYILLKRVFNNQGKSTCRVNGQAATVSIIKQIAGLLFDIHSQHDNHKLLNNKNHIGILDSMCPESFEQTKKEYVDVYNKYKSLKKSIKELDTDDEDLKKNIELYKYQINEIESANLQIDEEELLDNRRFVLLNSNKLQTYCDNMLDLLYRSEDNAAIDQISLAIDMAVSAENMDNNIGNVSEELSNAYTIIEEVVNVVRHYADNIESDPQALNEVEDRISLIYDLKKKYGNSIENILKYKDNCQERLDKILHSEDILNEYRAQLESILSQIKQFCSDITKIRSNVAETVSKKIQNTLYDLSMESAQFKISVDSKTEFDASGADDVEFLISANKGEPLKPLTKIASGGEMSRVMLALKTVLADTDNIGTFIFDEIDTGISGRTAQKVAEQLKHIAKNHQILCITHLPQIAAMADTNYLIKKSTVDNSAITNIIKLNENEVYNELARLIGGATITSSTLLAAKEMKEMAIEKKES